MFQTILAYEKPIIEMYNEILKNITIVNDNTSEHIAIDIESVYDGYDGYDDDEAYEYADEYADDMPITDINEMNYKYLLTIPSIIMFIKCSNILNFSKIESKQLPINYCFIDYYYEIVESLFDFTDDEFSEIKENHLIVFVENSYIVYKKVLISLSDKTNLYIGCSKITKKISATNINDVSLHVINGIILQNM